MYFEPNLNFFQGRLTYNFLSRLYLKRWIAKIINFFKMMIFVSKNLVTNNILFQICY